MKGVLRLFGLLTLFALAVSSAIPQGWMPAQGNDGKVLLVLCTGEGTVEQWVDLNPEDPLHDDGDERVMCPFGGLTADANLPEFGISRPSALSVQLLWPRRDFSRDGTGSAARYDARAPPVFS